MVRLIDVVIYREGPHWLAQALNVDVSTFGDTPEEARAAIKDALALYFQDEPAEPIESSEPRIEQVAV